MEKEVTSQPTDRKLADPVKASVDAATQEMIRHAQYRERRGDAKEFFFSVLSVVVISLFG